MLLHFSTFYYYDIPVIKKKWTITLHILKNVTFSVLFMQTEVVFSGNVSSGVVGDLTPGKTYTFRLRSSNIAGYSEPSNSQTYLHPGM